MNKKQKTVFFLLIFPLIIHFGLRSVNHIRNLVEAQKTVSETKSAILNFKDKNRLLRDSLSYVESTDFLDQEAHEKFGLGEASDALLNLPQPSPNSKFDYFYPHQEQTPPPSNLTLWLNLFVY